jgi:hypothetical protein
LASANEGWRQQSGAGRSATVVGVLLGLVLSALLVAGLLYGASRVAGYYYKADMRATWAALPPYREVVQTRLEENWENLPLYWQSEGVLPRIVGYYRSEHPTGAVVTHYREQLTAAGWQQYQEPWSLYPAYRRSHLRLAILFQQAFAHEWEPAGDFEVHLWSYPMLETFLNRPLAR